MRPYLAVLIDAFNAALASRVLWAAFIAIWLLLAALAPIGYREGFTTNFRWQDLEHGKRLKAMMAVGLTNPDQQQSPAGKLAEQMPAELQRELRKVGEGEDVPIFKQKFADAFNELLHDDSWYDAQVWSSTLRLSELRQLEELTDEELSEPLRQRRARLRIEAAFPGVFAARASRSITVTYAGMDFPADFAVNKAQFVTLINTWVIPTMINWLLGFALVFLGILVTASIVPDMLQPGSLHLLLSKPISRTLLLLTKFLGGCAFVFLSVCQLVIGLWLIAGTRLDIWNLRIWWCIPVSVFLFAVFYSVSVAAGLRWRSPILAIGITCMFGAICMVMGVIGSLFDGLVKRPDSIRSVLTVDDTMIATTRGGGLMRLDRPANRWVEVIESGAMSRNRVLSPVEVGGDLVVTANVQGGRFNPFGSGRVELVLLTAESKWEPQPSLELPAATQRLISAGPQHLLAANTGDLMIVSVDKIITAAGGSGGRDDQPESPADTDDVLDGEGAGDDVEADPNAVSGWLAGLVGLPSGKPADFVSVLPGRMALVSPARVAAADDGQSILIYSHGRLVRLQRPEDDDASTWTLAAEYTFPGEPSKAVELAYQGETVAVAREDEAIQFLDAVSLAGRDEIELADRVVPGGIIGIGDGLRFAVLTGDGRVQVISLPARSSQPSARPLTIKRLAQHDVETIRWDRLRNELIVAHNIDRVDVLDANSYAVVEQIRPSLGSWRFIDRYVIGPLRLLIPQTGELGQTVSAIISGETSVAIDQGGEDEIVRYQIARPVLSCAGFIAVMLLISCVYFARSDF